MNRTWRSVFSLLLAIALLLPMAPAARAAEDGADEIMSITSNVSGNKIYYRDKDNAGTITVTITVLPSTYTGKVLWSLDPADGPLKIVKEDTVVSGGAASITLQAASTKAAAGESVRLTAKVDSKTDSKLEKYLDITVLKDSVDVSSVYFSQSEVSVETGKSVQLSFVKNPTYPSDGSAAPVTYYTNDAGIATVDANGKVTGVKAGRAEITAKVDDQMLYSKVVVSVLAPTTDLTGNATVGTRFSLQNIFESLLSQYSSTYGAPFTQVKFTGLSRVSATLRTAGGDAVENNGLYTYNQFRSMYLEPTSEGTFTCTAEVSDGTNEKDITNRLSGKISVTVSVPTQTIRIPISGSSNYTFSQPSADSSGKSGAQIIRDSLGTFGSLVFGAVDSDSSSVGTLYTGLPANADTRVNRGTSALYTGIDEMYFTPSRAGIYTVPFTAYHSASGFGSVACTGELIIPVDGSSLDVTVNLDRVEPRTFSNMTTADSASLYSRLLGAINGSVGGSTWTGIKFDGAANASSCGTLHLSSSNSRAVLASDYIPKSSISQLYYVPARAGTYEITYGVYGSTDAEKPLATGKLTIVCSTIPSGLADITYTTSVGKTIALKESDFVEFFQKENGARYLLSYVTFNEYSGDGAFYHGAEDFVPYNSPDVYTSTYTGSLPSNAHYLDRLSFKSPAASGLVTVMFTCHGGTTQNTSTRETTGKLCIFYTASDVPTVSFNAYSVVTKELTETEFVTAYNAAMKSTVAKPAFNIQLLSVPTKGTLYYYYSASSRKAITPSNLSEFTFSVNNSAGTAVSNLAYAPGSNAFGTDTITYVATSASGAMLYVGEIQFKLSSDILLNVTNDGSDFQLSDFYSANDNDPVSYLTFLKPSSGKVYYYNGSRYELATNETKFYTVYAPDGQYPITSAFYAPRANETGTVSLKCILHRRSGVTNETTLTINVLSKVSSGSFGDVTGVTGWASNSIDFASKIGLVKGTQVNPPLFSPSNTMRRCDFVLMLYRLAGSPKVADSMTFSDVTSDKYYYDSAVWAFRNNIMRNVTVNNLYDPEGALTRQDFAQILFNYTNAMGVSTSNAGSISSYTDASKVSSNTLEGVTWAVARGYITSAVAGQLYIEPQRAATRAEISTLLHRYLTY